MTRDRICLCRINYRLYLARESIISNLRAFLISSNTDKCERARVVWVREANEVIKYTLNIFKCLKSEEALVSNERERARKRESAPVVLSPSSSDTPFFIADVKYLPDVRKKGGSLRDSRQIFVFRSYAKVQLPPVSANIEAIFAKYLLRNCQTDISDPVLSSIIR